MGIKYSIKDIKAVGDEKDSKVIIHEYDVTVSANKDGQGEMIFTIRLIAPTSNSIDVESIAKMALLGLKSGIIKDDLIDDTKVTPYQFTVN